MSQKVSRFKRALLLSAVAAVIAIVAIASSEGFDASASSSAGTTPLCSLTQHSAIFGRGADIVMRWFSMSMAESFFSFSAQNSSQNSLCNQHFWHK